MIIHIQRILHTVHLLFVLFNVSIEYQNDIGSDKPLKNNQLTINNNRLFIINSNHNAVLINDRFIDLNWSYRAK